MRIHRWIGRSIEQIADELNPIIRGKMQYYGAFYRSEMYPILRHINTYLMRWFRKKFKRLKTAKRATAAWQRITAQQPELFAHWKWAADFWWQG
jgi:RNA-directed DNA polymerase